MTFCDILEMSNEKNCTPRKSRTPQRNVWICYNLTASKIFSVCISTIRNLLNLEPKYVIHGTTDVESYSRKHKKCTIF